MQTATATGAWGQSRAGALQEVDWNLQLQLEWQLELRLCRSANEMRNSRRWRRRKEKGGRRRRGWGGKLDEEQGPMADDDFLAIELAIFSRLPF